VGSATGALWAGLDQPVEEIPLSVAALRDVPEVSADDELHARAAGDSRGVDEHPDREWAPTRHDVLRPVFPAAVFLAGVPLKWTMAQALLYTRQPSVFASEPGGQGVAQSGAGAISHPGDVPVRADHHGDRGAD
jgi:hypothetical protein